MSKLPHRPPLPPDRHQLPVGPVVDTGTTSAGVAHAMAYALPVEHVVGHMVDDGRGLVFHPLDRDEQTLQPEAPMDPHTHHEETQHPLERDHALQSALVAPYRWPADAAKDKQEPAPPWATDVAKELVRVAGGPIRHRQFALYLGQCVLRWCAAGEPVSRATRAIAYLRLWPGSPMNRMQALGLWLEVMERTGAGRPRFRDDGEACAPRPFVAPVTYRNWDAYDAAKKPDGSQEG